MVEGVNDLLSGESEGEAEGIAIDDEEDGADGNVIGDQIVYDSDPSFDYDDYEDDLSGISDDPDEYLDDEFVVDPFMFGQFDSNTGTFADVMLN